MIRKHLICPERRRRVPRQFSWIDHRLVRHRHICRCSPEALALYLFLVTVSDQDGLSYYSDSSARKYLNMRPQTFRKARSELIGVGLVAYDEPIYQVLPLDPPPAPSSLVAPPMDGDDNDNDDDDNPAPPLTPAPAKPPVPPTVGGGINRLKQTAHIGTIINTVIGKELS